MTKKKIVFNLLIIIFTSSLYGNVANYSGAWEWNNNVKIDFIYGYESNRDYTHFLMDNGQFCYISSEEKNLLSMLLSIRATNSTVQIVCHAIPDKKVDGKDSRKVHRIKF